MIVITDSAVEPGWAIDTNESLIALNWLPFVFVHHQGCSVFSEIPKGFYPTVIPSGSRLIKTSRLCSEISEQRGEKIYPFSNALKDSVCLGGTLYLPKDYHAWLDLIHAENRHPFLDSLKEWYFSSANQCWHFGDKSLDLKAHPVMGIWNVSPDSFSSDCEEMDASGIEFAQKLLSDGADILDIGAESTRPGAVPVSAEEEIQRLEQPLKWLQANSSIPVSLDSRHFKTISHYLKNHDIDIVNDIGMTSENDHEQQEIFSEVERYGAGLIIMAYESHENIEQSYSSCVENIVKQLWSRLNLAYETGIDLRRVIVDPGIGFGKGLDNDFRLIFHAPLALMCLGRPVLIAHSRKRCLSKALGLPKQSLDIPTAITAAMSFLKGAAMVRVHHVAETKVALRTLEVSFGVSS